MAAVDVVDHIWCGSRSHPVPGTGNLKIVMIPLNLGIGSFRLSNQLKIGIRIRWLKINRPARFARIHENTYKVSKLSFKFGRLKHGDKAIAPIIDRLQAEIPEERRDNQKAVATIAN